MAKMIFVNLPVSDLARSTAFYQAIGAEKNPQFSDDTASCMVFSETIYVMLLTHDKYRQFTPKKIADAKVTSQVLLCLSADSREAVDDMVAEGARRGRRRRSGPEAGLRLHVWPQFRGSRRSPLGSDVDGCRGSHRGAARDGVSHRSLRVIASVAKQSTYPRVETDCFAEPVIGRAFARPSARYADPTSE